MIDDETYIPDAAGRNETWSAWCSVCGRASNPDEMDLLGRCPDCAPKGAETQPQTEANVQGLATHQTREHK